MVYHFIGKQTWVLKLSKYFITSYSHINIKLIMLHLFKKRISIILLDDKICPLSIFHLNIA